MISLNSKTTFIVENTDTKKLEKIFLVVKGEELLIDEVSQNLALIDNEQYKWSEMTVKTEHFIGYLDNNSLYALELEDESLLMAETSLKPFRTLLGIIPDIYFGICSRSIQLVEWNKKSKYCGGCGSETSLHSIEKAMICNNCNNLIYPRISPCIIVLVTHKEKLLLAHNKGFPGKMYSTLAGFIEVG